MREIEGKVTRQLWIDLQRRRHPPREEPDRSLHSVHTVQDLSFCLAYKRIMLINHCVSEFLLCLNAGDN